MARLPALIDDLAQHDGRGRPTVELIARNIREEGLIQTTKRGRGAADMTTLDAAALLIGLCVAETPKSAPDAVRTFGELIPYRVGTWQVGNLKHPPELANLARSKNLLSAISHIIADMRIIGDYIRSQSKQPAALLPPGLTIVPHILYGGAPSILVSFSLPIPSAHISITWEQSHGDGRVGEFNRQFGRMALPDALVRAREEASDRSMSVTVGFTTFERLHKLLMTSDARST